MSSPLRILAHRVRELEAAAQEIAAAAALLARDIEAIDRVQTRARRRLERPFALRLVGDDDEDGGAA